MNQQSYPRVLIALYHSWIDTSSGAAISLRDTMKSLAARGWPIRVFCGPLLDFGYSKTCEQVLSEQRISFRKYRMQQSTRETDQLQLFRDGPISAAQYIPYGEDSSRKPPGEKEGMTWLRLYYEQLDTWKPDIVLTYGGYSLCPPTLHAARVRGIQTVFYLCNFAYTDLSLFNDVSVTITASHYHADAYRQTLGLDSVPIYPLIRRENVIPVTPPEPEYVTFVNPVYQKGILIFAKIVEILSNKRPDIPMLVVDGRSRTQKNFFLNTSTANLFRMRNTPCPADYYRQTRLLLVPSLWRESFGRVAAEAMMCGIPVLASDRGSLPEVIGDAGFLFHIPEKYTPESRLKPTEEVVAPWIETLIRLWDHPDEYRAASEKSLARARLWDESRVADQFERLLMDIVGL